MFRSHRQRVAAAGLFALSAAAFWVLRVWYWRITLEHPFSDMADFENIALRFLERGDFGHGDFWLSYRPPMLPLLRAGVIAVIGRDADLSGWRWFLAALTFSALAWMCFEVVKLTQRWWVGLVFFAVVALSKSSIFWSLKIASEGVSEACLYLAVAASLFAECTGRRWAYVLAGLTYAFALLARPVYVVIALLVPPLLLLRELVKQRRERQPLRRALVLPGLVCAGIALGWAPWLERSARLYGHLVPLTTQGPYSFMWEYGEFTVTVDGDTVTTDVHRLQSEAPSRFAQDYEASQYAGRLARAWVSEHWREVLARIAARVPEVVRERGEALSQVPREVLFPASPIDGLLFDKGPFIVAAGVLGLLILAWRFKPLSILVVVCLGSWGLGVVTLGLGRMIEPVLPMILAANAGWLLVIEAAAARLRARSAGATAPSPVRRIE